MANKRNYMTGTGTGTNFEYQTFEYDPYRSKYENQLADSIDRIQNYGDFKYDYTKDDGYKQYAKAYEYAGKDAMHNTMAKQAERTGGIANSYASAAAHQSYNNYMQALADKVPELRQLAYSEWNQGRNNAKDLLSMYQNADALDYARYQNDYNNAYNNYQNLLSQAAEDRARTWALEDEQRALARSAARSSGGGSGRTSYGSGTGSETQADANGDSFQERNTYINDVVDEAINAYYRGYDENDIASYIASIYGEGTPQYNVAMLKYNNSRKGRVNPSGNNTPGGGTGAGARRSAIQ